MGSRGERRGSRSVALVVTAALIAGACGIGDRQRNADIIHASRDLVAASGVGGTVTYELELHPRSREEFAQLRGTAPPDELVLRAELVVDAAASRSEVRFGAADLPAPPLEEAAAAAEAAEGAVADSAPAPPESAPAERPVAAIFDGGTVYVKRQNVRPRERRTWASLDFRSLPDEEPRPTREDLSGGGSLVVVATTFDPVHLLDLTAGALAGSTRRQATETLEDGTTVTRYSANISLDNAMSERDLDEAEEKTRVRMFRLIGVRDDVVPAWFWLDGAGALRRMRVELPQRVNRRRADRLVVTLDLTGPAAPVASAPAPEETVTYKRYGRMLRAAVPAAA